MIHQYKLNGYNIVLDVYSGSVHAVDELAYAAIALIDAGHPRAEAADLLAKKYADHPEVTAEDINDCFDDIEELKADGKLFAEDIYADHAFDFKNRSTVVKALCLHVAHTCNLNCEYCFAAQGKFHGQSGLMSFELKTDDREQIASFVDRLEWFQIGCSWGGHESLAIPPMLNTPQEHLDEIGSSRGLIRISIGHEGAETLIADLEASLEKVRV